MRELFNYIKKINLKIKFLSTDIFAGEYVSAFKGQGIEFEEVREYYQGDDIKTIDWNTSARTGKLHTKIFREERELTVTIMVDISGSMYFGSKWAFKSNLATEIAALLSYTALRSNDKVSLLLFDDKVRKFIPPRKGKKHIWQIIKTIVRAEENSKSTDFEGALMYLANAIKKKSIVFIISDFISKDYSFLKLFKILRKRFDFVPFLIADPLEESFKCKKLFAVKDPESGRFYNFKPEIDNSHIDFIKEQLRHINIRPITAYTNKPYIMEIVKYFREKRS